MANSIKRFSELKIEKNKLKVLGDEQMKGVKQSLDKVKHEGQNVLINKILIPVGAALIVGYGLKKLVDILSSDDDQAHKIESNNRDGDLPVNHQIESPHPEKRNSFFSNVDWADLLVRVAPFVIGVGKKMYEDGNLPFFDPPVESDGMNEI